MLRSVRILVCPLPKIKRIRAVPGCPGLVSHTHRVFPVLISRKSRRRYPQDHCTATSRFIWAPMLPAEITEDWRSVTRSACCPSPNLLTISSDEPSESTAPGKHNPEERGLKTAGILTASVKPPCRCHGPLCSSRVRQRPFSWRLCPEKRWQRMVRHRSNDSRRMYCSPELLRFDKIA